MVALASSHRYCMQLDVWGRSREYATHISRSDDVILYASVLLACPCIPRRANAPQSPRSPLRVGGDGMLGAMVLAEAATLGVFAGTHGPCKTSEQDLALPTSARYPRERRPK